MVWDPQITTQHVHAVTTQLASRAALIPLRLQMGLVRDRQITLHPWRPLICAPVAGGAPWLVLQVTFEVWELGYCWWDDRWLPTMRNDVQRCTVTRQLLSWPMHLIVWLRKAGGVHAGRGRLGGAPFHRFNCYPPAPPSTTRPSLPPCAGHSKPQPRSLTSCATAEEAAVARDLGWVWLWNRTGSARQQAALNFSLERCAACMLRAVRCLHAALRKQNSSH